MALIGCIHIAPHVTTYANLSIWASTWALMWLCLEAYLGGFRKPFGFFHSSLLLLSTSDSSNTDVSAGAMFRPIPVPINYSDSLTQSSRSQSSLYPPSRNLAGRRPIVAKTVETNVCKQSQTSKSETEERVGKLKGPLKPEQRKKDSEIRKLRACLRCKFLKMNCDKGEPCAGCQPLHARLWQVPFTRIDIKEIAYFMKDWKADYKRHIAMGFSLGNIKGFSDQERTLFTTHGYGQLLPIQKDIRRVEHIFPRDKSKRAFPSKRTISADASGELEHKKRKLYCLSIYQRRYKRPQAALPNSPNATDMQNRRSPKSMNLNGGQIPLDMAAALLSGPNNAPKMRSKSEWGSKCHPPLA
ncbi:uncharacterized protein N7496_005625 [Penicillium cataractarum]|uniref:Zn(2)-C6 fungal-type domain-containing protein n=1 Tax=Penicillium cataractarum TaxID=2100454 RepID=A0A9W9SGJ6_9EURO|nr:uncharacterized protein N7496_005625 [Penicillium cataractarum]KAJ5378216.1 hypothetical protein N7496_005625 [Penicillium cataractarum]